MSVQMDVAERESTTRRLLAALQDDEFILYRQEIRCLVDNLDGRPGHEIFIRMREEEQKQIPPGSFIPLLEELRLMTLLDRWVVRRVLRWMRLKRTTEPDWALPRNSINLAADTLADEGFVDHVQKHIEASELPAWTLSFEIPCDDAFKHGQHVLSLLSGLRPLGCSFSLTRFTGDRMSQVLLETVRPDFVKLSPGLIARIDHDPDALLRLGAIRDRCRAMNIRTIAEFVESEQTMEQLRTCGIDYAQGFCVGFPEPLI